MKPQIFVTGLNVDYDEVSIPGVWRKRQVNRRTTISANISTASGNLSVKVRVSNYVPSYGISETPEDIIRKVLAEAAQC